MEAGRRMTFEEQRALRQQQQRDELSQRPERTADRYRAENYASDRTSGTGRRTSAGSRKTVSASRVAGRATERTAGRTAGQRRSVSGSGSTSGSQRQSVSQRGERQASSRPSTRSQATSRATGQSRADGQARQAGNTTRDRFARGNYGGTLAAGRPRLFKIGIAIVLIVAVVLIVRMCSAAIPINVTVNGTQYELRGAKTMQTALKESGLPINPGDLISLNGNILEKSAGQPFSADVSGQQTADPNYQLRDGDVVNVTDGDDIVEDYDAVQEAIPFSASIAGVGAVHKFSAGTEGVKEIRTGRVSGETVEKQVTAPEDAMCTQYNLNAGANKMIAITLDDGPSSEYTATVLDILKENDAKATFFCIGQCVEEHPDLVKREADEGHQVCTHSYDHAEPVGGTDIGLMDAAGQVDEIVHGMKTITDVLGGEASRVVRMPGGNMNEAMVLNLYPYVDYEIGWNIDTQDWTLPGAEAIYQQIIAAQPGDIILCHDGGGDRSETVEALSRAIPYLKSKGYSFVTMDEMLKLPTAAA